MFTTAVRIEHDLGVPSVSLNTPTGHRSCTPEDCSGLIANPPQGPVPVSGVFPAGATLHLLETRLQANRLSPVGFQNADMAPDQRLQAAISYSLRRPPRIGRRRILPWTGSGG